MFDPLNNWGNRQLVTREYADRKETNIERTSSPLSWALVIGVLIFAKWYLSQ